MIVRDAVPELSVVVPAHNESANLPTLLGELSVALDRTGRSHEIVVVDDHSDDDTQAVLADLMRHLPAVRVLRTDRRSGQSAALGLGFDECRGSVIVTIDADLQNDPADLPKLVAELDGCDMAIGWRRDRKDPVRKKVISKVANFVRNAATGESVRDTGCGLKAFKAEIAERIHRFDGMHRFFPTLARMHGYTVREVPVNHRPRTRGRTHYNILNRSVRPIMDLMSVRWLQKRVLTATAVETTVLPAAQAPAVREVSRAA